MNPLFDIDITGVSKTRVFEHRHPQLFFLTGRAGAEVYETQYG
jgi:hypothetical protein